MNFLARDFYVAASNASKRSKKRMVTVKKKGDTETMMFGPGDTRSELKKELEQAEKLYHELEGKITKKKLREVKARIDALKKKLEEAEEEKPLEDSFEYNGVVMSPPLFEDINQDLEEFDREMNIPSQMPVAKEKLREEENRLIDIPEPEIKPLPPNHFLNIPPPPPKKQNA